MRHFVLFQMGNSYLIESIRAFQVSLEVDDTFIIDDLLPAIAQEVINKELLTYDETANIIEIKEVDQLLTEEELESTITQYISFQEDLLKDFQDKSVDRFFALASTLTKDYTDLNAQVPVYFFQTVFKAPLNYPVEDLIDALMMKAFEQGSITDPRNHRVLMVREVESLLNSKDELQAFVQSELKSQSEMMSRIMEKPTEETEPNKVIPFPVKTED